MIWHSDISAPGHRRRRNARRGVVLFEALIGAAVLAIVIVTGLAALSGAATREADRVERIWLAKYARSKAEEYAISYPHVAERGSDEGGWNWRVSERRVRPDGESPFDRDIALIELSISVWNASAPGRVFEGTTIMARRP